VYIIEDDQEISIKGGNTMVFISSIIYTKEDEELEKAVAEELKVPDPEDEVPNVCT